MSEPLKRRDNGQFAPGGPGGPGRPRRGVEADYLRSLSDRVTPDAWAAIVDEAMAQAQPGDAAARNWLSRYLCGGATLAQSLTLAEQMERID
jgi:hypothetical protein